MSDPGDLARVTQFIAVRKDAMFPKEAMSSRVRQCKQPDFTEFNEPHAVLARLPLPLYITTNYDDFMLQALQTQAGKQPIREICRWNTLVRDAPSVFDANPPFQPSPSMPIVFHLHGHLDTVESMVLTEDDYLDFLVNHSRDSKIVPPRIQRALSSTSLMFIGYNLSDWNFRVVFRSLISSTEPGLRRLSVAVQLPRGSSEEEFFEKYLGEFDVTVYWGTAREFAHELWQRWRDFTNHG